MVVSILLPCLSVSGPGSEGHSVRSLDDVLIDWWSRLRGIFNPRLAGMFL